MGVAAAVHPEILLVAEQLLAIRRQLLFDSMDARLEPLDRLAVRIGRVLQGMQSRRLGLDMGLLGLDVRLPQFDGFREALA